MEETKPRKERKAKLDEWLRIDLKIPRKQCHTNTRIYDRLQEEYSGNIIENDQLFKVKIT